MYKNQNLGVRVEESSKKPDYLAIKFLYQGGQTEIVGVDVAQVCYRYIIYISCVTNTIHKLRYSDRKCSI